MSAIKERFGGFRAFCNDVVVEMKKTTWPTRQELFSSTIVVIVSAILLSVFVGVCDKVLMLVLSFLIPSG